MFSGKASEWFFRVHPSSLERIANETGIVQIDKNNKFAESKDLRGGAPSKHVQIVLICLCRFLTFLLIAFSC